MCITTEVRTNIFTSSEPLHCIHGQFSAYGVSVNTPCDTIDTDYGFYLLKNMLCGSMEMSGTVPMV